jgi:hypothetical protein
MENRFHDTAYTVRRKELEKRSHTRPSDAGLINEGIGAA